MDQFTVAAGTKESSKAKVYSLSPLDSTIKANGIQEKCTEEVFMSRIMAISSRDYGSMASLNNLHIDIIAP